MTFTDDFSSGSLAGYTGVTDISATPTGGPDGSFGIIGTGTSSQQYYAELEKVFAAATRHGRAAFTFDCAAAGESVDGNYNIDIRTQSAGASILYCSQAGTSPYDLQVFNEAGVGGGALPALTLAGVLLGGAFTRVELRWQLSTETLGVLDSNGWWQVWINGSYVGGETSVKVGVLFHGWGAVGFAPMGAGSDILISDDMAGTLETMLPGPLTADTSFIIMPEGDSPFPYGDGNPTLVVAGNATVAGSPLATVAVNAIIDSTGDPLVALCGRRGGGWWQAFDNALTGCTDFIDEGKPGPTHLLSSNALVCNGPQGDLKSHRDLLELPTGDLVSIVRSTGALVRLSGVDGTVVQTYGLTINSVLGFDGAVNSLGNSLLYLRVEDANNGPTQVRGYDLNTDTDIGTLFEIPGVAFSLVWLPTCTIAVAVMDAIGNVTGRRYSLRGKPLTTYDLGTIDPGEGVYGIAANSVQDRLWMVLDWDGGESSEQVAVVRFKLSTGEVLGPRVPLLGELTDYDNICAITQPYYENLCVPIAPPPLSTKQWALQRFDIMDRREQTS